MILLSYSGGKDSTAMLLFARSLGVEFMAVYQDTGFEHPIHYKYLDYIQEKTGITIYRIKNEKYDGLIDMVEKKNEIPNRVARFCTEKLKTDAMKQMILSRSDVEEVWIGVRTEESEARAKRYAGFSYDDTFPLSEFPQFSKRDFGDIKVRMPIVDWSIKDVWDIHDNNAINRHPLYDFGDERVGCYPCVISSEKSWYNVWKTPEGKKNIRKLAGLEKKVNDSKSDGVSRTFRYKKTVNQLISKFELLDAQLDMFEELDDSSVKCSWCHD